MRASRKLSDAETRPQGSLQPMLRIDWARGPDLPQGLQDCGGGIVDDTLITVCGFCNGDASKAGPEHRAKYRRGFLRSTWGLDLSSDSSEWMSLPDFPGAARQGVFSIVSNDALYVWSGFSYTPPFCYRDGYRLSRVRGEWQWASLPPLPWEACGGGACAVGAKIYLFGGADYDENQFYTSSDRTGGTARLGARLLVLDTTDESAGFRELAPCPGTPRWVAAVVGVGGSIYVLGGATGDVPGIGYCTVVDNWVYDPALERWSRIRDLPVSSGNFPSGSIAFEDRYILLVGGFQYAKVANPDGTIRESYGAASRHEGGGDYFNDVFVYDTRTNLFGTASSLPLNNNLPFCVVRGNDVFLIGGETGGALVEGERYGQHPDLLLRGRIPLASLG